MNVGEDVELLQAACYSCLFLLEECNGPFLGLFSTKATIGFRSPSFWAVPGRVPKSSSGGRPGERHRDAADDLSEV